MTRKRAHLRNVVLLTCFVIFAMATFYVFISYFGKNKVSAPVDIGRKEIFEQQYELLNLRMAEQSLAEMIAHRSPVRTWIIEDDFMGEGELSDLFSMMPLVMTGFAMSILDSDVARKLQASGSMIKVLKIKENACLTVVADSDFAFVVKFNADHQRWVPMSAKLYEFAESGAYDQIQKEKAVDRLRDIMGNNFEIEW